MGRSDANDEEIRRYAKLSGIPFDDFMRVNAAFAPRLRSLVVRTHSI
jgi:hypothetical protein